MPKNMVRAHVLDGDALRIAVCKKGGSIKKFADNIGISDSYLTQIINRIRVPSTTVAGLIIGELGGEMEDFFSLKIECSSNN